MTPGRCAPGVFCLQFSGHPFALLGGLQIGEELRLTLIAIFGAAGTLARYGLQGLVQIRVASTFPYGTLLVNLTGCVLLCLVGQFTLNRMVISPVVRVAIAVAFSWRYT